MTTRRLALTTLLLVASATPGLAQDRGRDDPGRGAPPERRGGPAALQATDPLPAAAEKIAWFGTWQEGLAEAGRTGRPILLVAAAPQCHEAPGIW